MQRVCPSATVIISREKLKFHFCFFEMNPYSFTLYLCQNTECKCILHSQHSSCCYVQTHSWCFTRHCSPHLSKKGSTKDYWFCLKEEQNLTEKNRSHLLFSLASSSAYCLNSSYIFLLKLSLRKNDQNLKSVFISWDWPTPNRFLSETHQSFFMTSLHKYNLLTNSSSACGECLRTVEAPSAVLVVSLLSEAIVPQHVVGRMPEFGQWLGGAAIASWQRGSFWWGGIWAAVHRRQDVFSPAHLSDFKQHYKKLLDWILLVSAFSHLHWINHLIPL